MIFTYVGYFCLILGSFILISAAIGILRFKDFYTRLHAAGKADSLGQALILIGLLLTSTWNGEAAKLLLIIFFIMILSPVATHALAHAASLSGIKPMQNNKKG